MSCSARPTLGERPGLSTTPRHSSDDRIIACSGQKASHVAVYTQETLALTGAPLGLNARAAAVGSDNYVATVTPAEGYAGGRPLLLSLVEDGVPLAQPRLVTDGDVKGGRYVSGMVDIYAGSGPAN